jgi:hypothetical protein
MAMAMAMAIWRFGVLESVPKSKSVFDDSEKM